MATAKAVPTTAAYPNGRDNTQRQAIHYGTIAVDASPATYSAGGLAINWAMADNRFSQLNPYFVEFQSRTGSGFFYTYNYTTNKMLIRTGAAAQTALTELTDGGAIPAGVSGDTIGYRAEWQRF
jgi:hypothetical protein